MSRILARKGLSQADLEAMTGLSRSVLAKVNRGEPVYEKTLARIGKALEGVADYQVVAEMLGEPA